MAEFCHFYPAIAPDVFWDLDASEYLALRTYMHAVRREQQGGA